jgi:hypothetical protein
MPREEKEYQQSGETMGLLRLDGSERPVGRYIAARSGASRRRPPAPEPSDTLVLFPCPLFQSMNRYRANLTGFALLTSLARQGILAEVAMTSAGGELIAAEDLADYRLVILGAGQYRRDHPQVPDVLAGYVEGGGALFLPLGHPSEMEDPYVRPVEVAALRRLSGCAELIGDDPCDSIEGIKSRHAAFVTEMTPGWELEMDRVARLAQVRPGEGAEVLVEADGTPLLYRHGIGEGTVYVFTWDLDVLLYRGEELDYPGGHWDWLWQGLASEAGLRQDDRNAMTATIRDMTW